MLPCSRLLCYLAYCASLATDYGADHFAGNQHPANPNKTKTKLHYYRPINFKPCSSSNSKKNELINFNEMALLWPIHFKSHSSSNPKAKTNFLNSIYYFQEFL